MNRKDLRLAAACLGLALWAFWPSWLNPGRLVFNYGDLQAYHYPLRHLVVEALQQGRLPLWNAYIFSGLPLAANPQAQLFYPGAVLAAFWPLTAALTWDLLLHFCWAVLGVALLARRARLRAPAAWALGLLYALSPFVSYRVVEGIPTLLAALAWVPWCWLAWSSGRPALLGAVWALQFLSGHPQFLLINAVGMGLWALSYPGQVGRLLTLARATAWAAALAAAQWVPTWEFLGRSVRRSWPAAYSLGYSLDPSALRSLLSPGAGGDPASGTYAGPPSVFFETHALWVGAVGLALALAGLAWTLRRRRQGPAALILVGVLFALGSYGPLGRAGLSILRTPSRWLLLTLWGLVLAAGTGLALAARRGPRGLSFALLLALAAELLVWDRRYLRSSDASLYLKPNKLFADTVGGARWRLITSPDLANPNKTALYHGRNANGYEAFYLDGYPQYASRSEGVAAADASRTYLSKLATPELDRLSVMWRVGADGLTTAPAPHPLAYFVYKDGRVISFYPLVTQANPERWRAVGEWPAGAARLVLSQPMYPGWRAWLNRRRAALETWDGLLQSLPRPPGPDRAPFTLELRFWPTAFGLWLAVSALAWAGWLARLEEAW